MTQDERFLAHIKSMDPRRPHLIIVKLNKDRQFEWWSDQGAVSGFQAPAPTGDTEPIPPPVNKQ